MNATEAATDAARAAAEILLHHWETLGRDDADLKSRNDWVSRADRESEKAIIRSLSERFPDDAFLGEEGGDVAARNSGSRAERTWIIDPLDGTSNYLQHFPFWSISIALREKNEVIAAVILEPLRDILFTAEKGAGAFRNGDRIQISSYAELDGSFLATGFPFRAQKYVATYCSIFQDVMGFAKGVRRAGSAALDLAYTAAGVFDGFFEMHLAPWDVAAGALLIREAGGVVTDFSGGDEFWTRGNIIGASPAIHARLLELVGKYVREDQL